MGRVLGSAVLTPVHCSPGWTVWFYWRIERVCLGVLGVFKTTLGQWKPSLQTKATSMVPPPLGKGTGSPPYPLQPLRRKGLAWGQMEKKLRTGAQEDGGNREKLLGGRALRCLGLIACHPVPVPENSVAPLVSNCLILPCTRTHGKGLVGGKARGV